jgi:hypothetical protein
MAAAVGTVALQLLRPVAEVAAVEGRERKVELVQI